MKTVFDAIHNSLIELHKEARKYHYRKNNKKSQGIFYGRSPSLAPFIEEKLAKELSKVYPKYKIFVDYPIRLCNKDETPIGSQNLYPDIMIVDKKNHLKAIIELKLDIGRLNIDSDSSREGLLRKAKVGFLNSVVGRYSDQQEKNERRKIVFAKGYKKILIVVTLVNEHKYLGKPKSEPYKKKLLKWGYIPLFLLKQVHYNTFEDASKKIKIELEHMRPEIQGAFRGI